MFLICAHKSWGWVAKSWQGELGKIRKIPKSTFLRNRFSEIIETPGEEGGCELIICNSFLLISAFHSLILFVCFFVHPFHYGNIFSPSPVSSIPATPSFYPVTPLPGNCFHASHIFQCEMSTVVLVCWNTSNTKNSWRQDLCDNFPMISPTGKAEVVLWKSGCSDSTQEKTYPILSQGPWSDIYEDFIPHKEKKISL